MRHALSEFVVFRFSKLPKRCGEEGYPVRAGWEEAIRTLVRMSNKQAAADVNFLNRQKQFRHRSAGLDLALLHQLDKTLNELVSNERAPANYEWALVQMSGVLREIDKWTAARQGSRHKPLNDPRAIWQKVSCKPTSNRKPKKQRFYEMVMLTAYFERSPRPNADVRRLYDLWRTMTAGPSIPPHPGQPGPQVTTAVPLQLTAGPQNGQPRPCRATGPPPPAPPPINNSATTARGFAPKGLERSKYSSTTFETGSDSFLNGGHSPADTKHGRSWGKPMVNPSRGRPQARGQNPDERRDRGSGGLTRAHDAEGRRQRVFERRPRYHSRHSHHYIRDGGLRDFRSDGATRPRFVVRDDVQCRGWQGRHGFAKIDSDSSFEAPSGWRLRKDGPRYSHGRRPFEHISSGRSSVSSQRLRDDEFRLRSRRGRHPRRETDTDNSSVPQHRRRDCSVDSLDVQFGSLSLGGNGRRQKRISHARPSARNSRRRV